MNYEMPASDTYWYGVLTTTKGGVAYVKVTGVTDEEVTGLIFETLPGSAEATVVYLGTIPQAGSLYHPGDKTVKLKMVGKRGAWVEGYDVLAGEGFYSPTDMQQDQSSVQYLGVLAPPGKQVSVGIYLAVDTPSG
jgi:hypothetical protein